MKKNYPIHLALTLPKGYAKEYHDRDLFNSIYFQKLSMSHEEEGYMPILYNFQLQQEGVVPEDLPSSMLMTFYYPETKRMSNLNGIIIIGGTPDIYEAYQRTKMITPYLESLTLSKHGIGNEATIATIDETLDQLANPTDIRPLNEIIERSQGKTGDDLYTFFPFLDNETYKQENLSLPADFQVDAVFMLGISPNFFQSTDIGAGINTLTQYRRSGSSITPSLAFPLIFKWQPIYNDILNQLKKDGSMLPPDYTGELIPSVIIFQRQDSNEMTALISSISEYQGDLYYHVAVANSGYTNGQPLSLVQSALSREKFGEPAWIDRLDNLRSIPQDSIRDQDFTDDLITSTLIKVVPETKLTVNGEFDLGKLRSIQLEDI